jgi:hypothetical protein
LTLDTYWTVEIVLTMDAVKTGYEDPDSGLAVDGDVTYFTILDKSGLDMSGASLRVLKNFRMILTNSDNGGNAENSDEGASPVSEGSWKIWVEWTGGAFVNYFLHPTDTFNPGGTYSPLQPGQTYHILVSKYIDAANDAVSIWVNGNKHSTHTGVIPLADQNKESGDDFRIGWQYYDPRWVDGTNYQSRSHRPFIGKLNELRVRNNTGMDDVNIGFYYTTYGGREVISSDNTDTRFDNQNGGVLQVYNSLSAYFHLNEGTGLPAPTKGCTSDTGVKVRSGVKFTSWDDDTIFTSANSQACLRFEGGTDCAVIPNASQYRDQLKDRRVDDDEDGDEIGDAFDNVQKIPLKATYRIRFKTPAVFQEDARAAPASQIHNTLWYMSTAEHDPFTTPNDATRTAHKHIWMWIRIRRNTANLGQLEAIWGDLKKGAGAPPPPPGGGYRFLNCGTLTADTEYCLFITTDYVAIRDRIDELCGVGTVKFFLVEDPDGTPVVTNGTDTTSTSWPWYLRDTVGTTQERLFDGPGKKNKYVMTLGGLPFQTQSHVPWKDEIISSAEENMNAILIRSDYQEHKDVIFIDEVSIFHETVILTDTEAEAYGPPLTASQITAFGRLLRSHWGFNEGSGDFAADSGALGNHLTSNVLFDDLDVVNSKLARGLWDLRPAFQPKDVTLWGKNLVTYFSSSPIYFLNDYQRKRDDRIIMAGGPGGVYQLDETTSALTVIYEGIEGTSSHWKSFIYGDFNFIMIPGGEVLKAIGTTIVKAGINAPVYLPETITDDASAAPLLGESGRRPSVAEQGTGEMENGATYLFAITYFSASTSVESPAGPILTVNTTGTAGSNVKQIAIGYVGASRHYLPRPQDPQVTHYRVYRSRANGSTLFFEDQFPVTGSVRERLWMRKADSDLGDPLDAFWNIPPPKSSMGVTFRGRAFYAGNEDDVQRLYASRTLFPEYVPSTYFVDLIDDNGSGIPIRGMKPLRDRVLVWTDQGSYLVIDNGGDVSLESPQDMPISVVPLQFDDGCVGRSAVSEIAGMGAIVGGQKGLYVTGGEQMFGVSGRIDPTYDAFPLADADSWQMLHYRTKDMLLLAVPTTAGGNLDTVLVWDYHTDRKAFILWEFPDFTVMSKFRSLGGAEEIWIGDEYGYIHQVDADELWDGLGVDRLVDAGLALSDTIGTASAGSDLDTVVLGKDFSSLGGDKLRGLEITVIHGDGTKERRKIITHTDSGGVTNVDVSPAFSTTVATGETWMLGSIDWLWESGWLNLGVPTSRIKRLHHILIENDPRSTVGNLTLTYQWRHDSAADSLTFLNNDVRVSPGPLLGSGDKLKISIGNDNPTVPGKVQYIDIGYFVKARRPYVETT